MGTSSPRFWAKLGLTPKRIKLCGLTRAEDVQLAATLGADLFGFVLAPSPRQISFDHLRELVKHVPWFSHSVAVVVDPEASEVERLLEVVDRVQFHGHETPEFCYPYRERAIKAFRIREAGDFDRVSAYDGFVRGYLFDSYVKGIAGGTGHSFPWAYLQERRFSHPAFLAGGVKVSNVGQALTVDAVCGIDVSSGIESSAGVKDHQLMRHFFEAAGR